MPKRIIDVLSGTHADPNGALAGTLEAANEKLQQYDRDKTKLISHAMSESMVLAPPSAPGMPPRTIFRCTVTFVIEVSDLVAATTGDMRQETARADVNKEVERRILGPSGQRLR